ncbi:hypothetical protein F5Y16DRAFT_425266 [Xylariaceae sp. FL0255]|nr:hypothetical protein F5Y16DRAFT_425266 [Xylariaceae sp. FL0255]
MSVERKTCAIPVKGSNACDEEEFEESQALIANHRKGVCHSGTIKKRYGQLVDGLPWIVVLITTSASIYFWLASHSCFGHFPTDVEDSWGAISYEQRAFTGRLEWDETRKVLYRVVPKDQPLYFGEPSKDIDEAWEEFSKGGFHGKYPVKQSEANDSLGKFLYMNDRELSQYKVPELKQFDNGHYYFEPQMFHSLYCLNVIRMKLDADYYEAHPVAHDHGNLSAMLKQDDWERVHIDHCLDQIRQSVQCFGDLSPVPVYSLGNISVGVGVGTAHTCRKWEPIKAWMSGRNQLGNQLREQW